jgi:hypothetical protein
MAYKDYTNGARPLSREELRLREQRRAISARKRMLAERQRIAISNMKERQAARSARFDDFGYGSDAENAVPVMDNKVVSDIQKMKFCRKPVGFLMSLVFLICIALIALPFVNLKIDAVTQYTALFAESPVTSKTEDATTDDSALSDETTDEASSAAASSINRADETTDDGSGDTSADTSSDTSSDETASVTYYSLSDPVYGWISYIAGLFNFDLDLGDSAWYDAQISKVESGMTDKIAPILIQAFPAAIILYAIFALALFIKTMVCWMSGDRRIYRHTGIEAFIMIILAAIVAFGGFATAVEINGTMNYAGIVNFLIGLFTKTGGFTAGYGMIIMIGLPLVGMILSWFLLERKLRSREVIQPVIVYDYKRRAQG